MTAAPPTVFGAPRPRHHTSGYLRDVLLTLVRVDASDAAIGELLDRVDVDPVVRMARRHRISALVHHRTRRIDGHHAAERLAAQLRPAYIAAHAHRLQVDQTIALLQRAIDVPFLIIKGPVLAATWYGEHDVRTYVDVDIIVRRNDLATALRTLLDAGLTHLSPNWDGLRARGMAEVPLRHQGCTIDLHWHPISRPRPRRELHLDEAALFARATPIRLGGVEVATFDHEDTLLHLCVNAGLDGARRLQQLVDVDRVTRSGQIAWSDFVARARLSGAHALCAAVLLRCRDLLATPLPHRLLSELSPFPGWLRANTIIDGRRRHDGRIYDGIASGVLLASGRATLRATASSLVRNVGDAAARHVSVTGERTGRGGRTGRATSHDDARSRQRYLAWVASSTLDH